MKSPSLAFTSLYNTRGDHQNANLIKYIHALTATPISTPNIEWQGEKVSELSSSFSIFTSILIFIPYSNINSFTVSITPRYSNFWNALNEESNIWSSSVVVLRTLKIRDSISIGSRIISMNSLLNPCSISLILCFGESLYPIKDWIFAALLAYSLKITTMSSPGYVLPTFVTFADAG